MLGRVYVIYKTPIPLRLWLGIGGLVLAAVLFGVFVYLANRKQ